MYMKKILVAIILGKFNDGGIEKVIMNYYKYINHNDFEFHFYCYEDSKNIPYNEIEKNNDKVLLLPNIKNVFKYKRKLTKLLIKYNYDISHVHCNTLSFLALKCSKKAGIKVRICSNHSTSNRKEFMRNIIKNLLKRYNLKYATEYFACSKYAGDWLYNKNNYFIMKNALLIDEYKYNINIRNEYRKKLNIKKDALVIGNISRFVNGKNHKLVIKIFKEIHKKNSNSILCLIGIGPLENKIKKMVKKYNLEDYVLFLGYKEDVNNYYQAFDIFLFPSLYEGLGLVLIEAQISGNLCFASSNVPNEVIITNNIKFISLNKNPTYWSNNILNSYKKYKRQSHTIEAKKNGYDITKEVKKLENKYKELVG